MLIALSSQLYSPPCFFLLLIFLVAAKYNNIILTLIAPKTWEAVDNGATSTATSSWFS